MNSDPVAYKQFFMGLDDKRAYSVLQLVNEEAAKVEGGKEDQDLFFRSVVRLKVHVLQAVDPDGWVSAGARQHPMYSGKKWKDALRAYALEMERARIARERLAG